MNTLEKLFDPGRRAVKKYAKTARDIIAMDQAYSALSDAALKHKTVEFKERLHQGASLDDLLPEAFATVREAASRTVNMKHFPVQLIGGMVLHNGDIAEMETGEGKTLVATLPAYLNALTGKGVFVVTVNDYLAKRDAQKMAPIYRFLGLTVGLVTSDMEPAEHKRAYACDITYGTNNEFGFDYLRDNMTDQKEKQVQRGLNYAIVDEVDSILIDEARTPLIISGAGNGDVAIYQQSDNFAKTLSPDDYDRDKKEKTVTLTESGIAKAERYFGVQNISDIDNVAIMHGIEEALYANYMMARDIDYIVRDGEVIIVDEFTGRPMPGRRFSNGLHQAIEAKEHVKINAESQTMASITLQNYFRLFNKLSGMTGTAKTEETEFREIYNLNVVTIPTNKPNKRIDMNDVVYASKDAKYKAVTEEVKKRHAKGQPVLIGTTSIENSETLSRYLTKAGIPHNVLNAKYLEREAEIIALSGQKGAVTISTNMAGRGTDIALGKGVAELGGLHVIGTERHESRRIDNQLRGRSARQGDPGSTQFFVSLEDDLMKRFGSEKLQKFAETANMADEPLESKMLTKSIESAQKRVEAKNYGIRKQVLQYDDVMNHQRKIIYGQRQRILDGENIDEQIKKMVSDIIGTIVCNHISGDVIDTAGIQKRVQYYFPEESCHISADTPDTIEKQIMPAFTNKRQTILSMLDDETMAQLERNVLLDVVDESWMAHIDDMDHLREGIGLRAYGQSDPVVEYKNEGYDMFCQMNHHIQAETIRRLAAIHIE